jgi:hypothetical protein
MVIRYLNYGTFSDDSLYLKDYLNKIYRTKFGVKYYTAMRSVYIYN